MTDAEWPILRPFLPPEAHCGRKRAWPMRVIVNAICHVLRGGITWHLMPDRFPPRRTVDRRLARLRDGGTWQRLAVRPEGGWRADQSAGDRAAGAA